MIHLITGAPGHGKTLLAVELLLKNSQSETIRPAFTNINGIALDKLKCFPLPDPDKWFDLPDGSLIVIDECQRWFRPRANGSTVPESVARMETHRHQGHDLILITQGPMLIDANIRKLVEFHQHAYRVAGSKFRTILEWNGCCDTPAPSQTHTTANKVNSRLNSEIFQYYQSASVHTDKLRFPYKLAFTGVLSLVVVAFCISSFLGDMEERKLSDTEQITSEPSLEASAPQNILQTSNPSLPAPQSILDSDEEEKPTEPEFVYLGWEKSSAGIEFYFRDNWKGLLLTMSDFTEYKKVGSGVQLTMHLPSGLRTFEIIDRELATLLP
jgi:zona occludens toxin